MNTTEIVAPGGVVVFSAVLLLVVVNSTLDRVFSQRSASQSNTGPVDGGLDSQVRLTIFLGAREIW